MCPNSRRISPVGSPTISARLLSFRQPLTISLADAEY